MNGGIPPLRDRHLAAGFVLVMYTFIGAFASALFAVGLTGSGGWTAAAAFAGGALGTAFGAWQLRRTPEAERADDAPK
ncbi:hypothetical protein [Streptomyces indicus]|uniref:Uncharacterized protein n=1 Tax=Streptomyces indicus TaxID=417292 RepID=A0A1G8T225_9ACTN|nr:hypothetical protein [Streptomyces indicus]SDJ35491.1 hypothetical protein SAMN05421806_1015 [Streptomyces indicus]